MIEITNIPLPGTWYYCKKCKCYWSVSHECEKEMKRIIRFKGYLHDMSEGFCLNKIKPEIWNRKLQQENIWDYKTLLSMEDLFKNLSPDNKYSFKITIETKILSDGDKEIK